MGDIEMKCMHAKSHLIFIIHVLGKPEEFYRNIILWLFDRFEIEMKLRRMLMRTKERDRERNYFDAAEDLPQHFT